MAYSIFLKLAQKSQILQCYVNIFDALQLFYSIIADHPILTI